MKTPDPDDPYLVIYDAGEVPEEERKVDPPSTMPEEEIRGSMARGEEPQ